MSVACRPGRDTLRPQTFNGVGGDHGSWISLQGEASEPMSNREVASSNTERWLRFGMTDPSHALWHTHTHTHNWVVNPGFDGLTLFCWEENKKKKQQNAPGHNLHLSCEDGEKMDPCICFHSSDKLSWRNLLMASQFEKKFSTFLVFTYKFELQI